MKYLRRNILDIEVKADKEFPHPEQARYPITAITVWDSYTNHYYTLVLRESPLSMQKVVMSSEWDIYYCNSEIVLATNFVKLTQMLNPDTWEGFFSKTFDFPYICNRLRNIEIDPNLLSPGGHFSCKNRPSSSGLHLLDIIEADRKFKKRSNESLKAISEEEKLSINKIEFDVVGTNYTPEQLAEYNKVDVEVPLALDNKMQHIKRYVNRWQLAGLESIDKAMSNSVVVDTVMLREAKKAGILLPSKPDKAEQALTESEDADITGGMVFVPIIGVHDWVADDDQSRFYPNLIFLLRMSPENISTEGTLISANGTRFIDNPEAFLPRIIRHFFKERDRIQAEKALLTPDNPYYWKLHEEDENAKFLLNSVAGVFGQPSFRLYEPRIIDSITTSGQYLMITGKAFLESLGVTVVYGDTDALHRKLMGVTNIEEAIKQGKEINALLNEKLPIWAQEKFNVKDASSIKIVFEKVFRRIMYIPNEKGKPVKKRYAARLVYEKGKITDQIYIRGFETRRSDASVISKDLQNTIFKKILYAEDVEVANKEIIAYIRDLLAQFPNRPLSEIAIPCGFSKELVQYGGLNKNGGKKGIDPEVRGAIYSNTHLFTNFGSNSKVKMLYLNKIEGTNSIGEPLPHTDVIVFEDEAKLPKIEVNYEKMVDATVRKKIERILSVAGIDWNQIVGEEESMFNF